MKQIVMTLPSGRVVTISYDDSPASNGEIRYKMADESQEAQDELVEVLLGPLAFMSRLFPCEAVLDLPGTLRVIAGQCEELGITDLDEFQMARAIDNEDGGMHYQLYELVETLDRCTPENWRAELDGLDVIPPTEPAPKRDPGLN